MMAFQAGYGYPVGNLLRSFISFEATSRKRGERAPDHDGWQPGARLRIDRRRRALRRGLSDHAVVVDHGNLARASCRNTAASSSSAEDEIAAVSMALGFSLLRPARRHRQRRPGHFAENGSDRLGVDGRDAAHHYQCSTRRTVHRHAHQRRAKRSLPGHLRRARRQPARRARAEERSKIVSTSRSKRPGSRANTARRFSF